MIEVDEILYHGQAGSNVAAAQRLTDMKAFLNTAIQAGDLVLDPQATCTYADLYAVYRRHRPSLYMSRQMFGRTLTAMGAPSIVGTGNVRRRGGIRIPGRP